MRNDIFWSEIRSGFGEPGGTPPPRIPRSTPPPRAPGIHNTGTERAERSSKKIRSVEDDKRARNDLSKTSSKEDLGESIRKLVMFLFVPKLVRH